MITLPWPPGVNNLFATFKNRRIRTRRYEAWLSAAGAALLEQRPRRVGGHFKVTIVCERPDKRGRDLDGLAKAPLDLLVKHGVIEDDSLANEIILRWSSQPPAKPGCVRLLLEAA